MTALSWAAGRNGIVGRISHAPESSSAAGAGTPRSSRSEPREADSSSIHANARKEFAR